MAFSDPSPLEEDMETPVTQMSPAQLVTYIERYHHAFGVDLPHEGHKEISIFKALQSTYGQEKAGLIVKWVFWKYKGRWRDQLVGYFDFSKARKWFTDQMALEYQDELRKEKPKSPSRVLIGSTRLSEL